jgi:hypothetical protein
MTTPAPTYPVGRPPLSIVTTGPIPAVPTALPPITVAVDQLRRREVAALTEEDTGKGAGKVANALTVVVGVALTAVIIAPIVLSAQHLIEWASSKAGLGLPLYFAWVVFLALDLAAVTCIGMVTLCAMRGEGAGGFKLGTWAFASISAYANYSGGIGAGKWFFPAMSMAGPTLLEMALAKVKSWAQISDGTKMSARPKFGVRWVPGIAFRETARAWAAARRENIAKTADAIAYVREVDVLAKMSDADVVRYAQSALRSTDTYQVRQWLTAHGRDVAQSALGPVTFARPAMPAPKVTVQRADRNPTPVDDISHEGAPLSETFAPMPKGLRAPRKALGLPPVPEPMKLAEPPEDINAHVARMAAKERAESAKKDDTVVKMPPRRVNGDPTDHPKWAKGVAAFRKSLADSNPMSQRELADYLEMKNRKLAAQIMQHVRFEQGQEG